MLHWCVYFYACSSAGAHTWHQYKKSKFNNIQNIVFFKSFYTGKKFAQMFLFHILAIKMVIIIVLIPIFATKTYKIKIKC